MAVWWKLLLLGIGLLVVYNQLSPEKQGGINTAGSKVKDYIGELIDGDNSAAQNSTIDYNSSDYNPAQQKVALGKIKTEVEIDCTITAQCQEIYGASSFCEGGTCYQLS